ncbi:MAG: replication-associated recombination protein A [Candidatus Nanopelagicales bacterium]
MRPASLQAVVGNKKALIAGGPLRLLLEGGSKTSVILWGPPGSGKTTLARLVSKTSDEFHDLSALSIGVKDIRDIAEVAKHQMSEGRSTSVFIDEIHRFNKAQQDALLPAVENGWITLLGATTENPYFSINNALLSRVRLVKLEALTDEDIELLLLNAIEHKNGLAGNYVCEQDVVSAITQISSGDARLALTLLENVANYADSQGRANISVSDLEAVRGEIVSKYDRDGDSHYDVTSAFIKSMRGSDVQAAIHYLVRMLNAGEDPRFIARRIVILASEDIGLADNSALQTAIAAYHAVSFIGMPEAALTLAHAVIHCSLAPKSNSVTKALQEASNDIRQGKGADVPIELRDGHYAGSRTLGHGVDYQYPHDLPGGIAPYEYLPSDLIGRTYYVPTHHGNEKRWAEVLKAIEGALGKVVSDSEKKGTIG